MPCIERAKKNVSLWDQLSEEEKAPVNELDLHEIQHECFKEFFPKEMDVHGAIDRMSDKDYAVFWSKVVARYRNRRKKRLSLANYLELQGRKDQAEEIRKQVKEEDEELEKQEEAQEQEVTN